MHIFTNIFVYFIQQLLAPSPNQKTSLLQANFSFQSGNPYLTRLPIQGSPKTQSHLPSSLKQRASYNGNSDMLSVGKSTQVFQSHFDKNSESMSLEAIFLISDPYVDTQDISTSPSQVSFVDQSHLEHDCSSEFTKQSVLTVNNQDPLKKTSLVQNLVEVSPMAFSLEQKDFNDPNNQIFSKKPSHVVNPFSKKRIIVPTQKQKRSRWTKNEINELWKSAEDNKDKAGKVFWKNVKQDLKEKKIKKRTMAAYKGNSKDL